MCPAPLFDTGRYIEVRIAFQGMDTGTIHAQVNGLPIVFGIQIRPAQLPEVHAGTIGLRGNGSPFTAEAVNDQTRRRTGPKNYY